MLDQEVKQKWVAALRSGEFKQGEGYLKSYDGCTCCLGVLAEINGIPSEPSGVAYNYKFVEGYPERYSVPEGFCGLDLLEMGKLIDKNDGNEANEIPKHSFDQIADYIEENL